MRLRFFVLFPVVAVGSCFVMYVILMLLAVSLHSLFLCRHVFFYKSLWAMASVIWHSSTRQHTFASIDTLAIIMKLFLFVTLLVIFTCECVMSSLSSVYTISTFSNSFCYLSSALYFLVSTLLSWHPQI